MSIEKDGRNECPQAFPSSQPQRGGGELETQFLVCLPKPTRNLRGRAGALQFPI